jgi:hypothetical protein
MTGADPAPPGPKPRPTDQGSRTAINGARLSGHRGWPSTPGTGALRSDTTKPLIAVHSGETGHPSPRHAPRFTPASSMPGRGRSPGATPLAPAPRHYRRVGLAACPGSRTPANAACQGPQLPGHKAPQSSRLKAHKTSIRSATNDHVGRPSERADRRFTLILESPCITRRVLAGIGQSTVAQPGGAGAGRSGFGWFVSFPRVAQVP